MCLGTSPATCTLSTRLGMSDSKRLTTGASAFAVYQGLKIKEEEQAAIMVGDLRTPRKYKTIFIIIQNCRRMARRALVCVAQYYMQLTPIILQDSSSTASYVDVEDHTWNGDEQRSRLSSASGSPKKKKRKTANSVNNEVRQSFVCMSPC